tara:strand:+ start:2552 stop:2869 length:318 start_codon:yes stop_codon:yes gene_type:complete
MSNSVEYEIAMNIHREAREAREALEALNLRLELAEFEARMLRKYNHLDLERLETDYDYYDCVFMEHFEMRYPSDVITEKQRLEGVEFMKMFKKPVNPEHSGDDSW